MVSLANSRLDWHNNRLYVCGGVHSGEAVAMFDWAVPIISAAVIVYAIVWAVDKLVEIMAEYDREGD